MGKKTISVFFLGVLMAGCGGGNKQIADELVSINVNAHYPEKELILQDFMEVEYVALETSDEFITQGYMCDVGKDLILVKNRRDHGTLFIFDRKTGKGLSKFNRLGQGSEEYSMISEVVLDENNDELFILDGAAKKISVYSLDGTYKRSFRFADTSYYKDLFNYDPDNLICYKSYHEPENPSSHVLISKKDGSITREIEVPFKEVTTPVVRERGMVVTPFFFTTIPYQGNWALMNTSADTVYTYLSDGNLRPLIARTPPLHTMDKEVFLFPKLLTDRYYFMQTMKKEVTPQMKIPTTDLVYDKEENAIFRYTVYNDDFSSKRKVSISSSPVGQEIAISESLDAFDLVEALENEELKGKLKEIAEDLDEESNPVIMLIKHKK